MSKKKKDSKEPSLPTSGGGSKLVELVTQGNNRQARAEARKLLADPVASEEDKALAADVLARTEVDKRVLVAGAVVLLVIAAAIFLIFTRG